MNTQRFPLFLRSAEKIVWKTDHLTIRWMKCEMKMKFDFQSQPRPAARSSVPQATVPLPSVISPSDAVQRRQETSWQCCDIQIGLGIGWRVRQSHHRRRLHAYRDDEREEGVRRRPPFPIPVGAAAATPGKALTSLVDDALGTHLLLLLLLTRKFPYSDTDI